MEEVDDDALILRWSDEPDDSLIEYKIELRLVKTLSCLVALNEVGLFESNSNTDLVLRKREFKEK